MASTRSILFTVGLTFAWPATEAIAACTPDTNGNSVGDGWGASWSFGPTTSRVIHARTTLVPGRVPPMTNTGPLFLWPGMSNPTSDLIQTTMDAWNGTTNESYCGSLSAAGLPTQWCVEASVFGSNGQTNGPTVAIDADDHVTIDYLLESDNVTWLQTVTSQKLGKVVSTLTSKSGEMPLGGFGFATEADSCAFTIDTQYYLCTEIDLFAADAHFGATGVGGIGAQMGNTGRGSGTGTAKNLHTPDNGKTWLVDLITLPAMNPQGTQTPPPIVDCASDGGSGQPPGTQDAGGSGGSGSSSGAVDAGRSGSGGSGAMDAGHAVDASGSGSSSGAGGADAAASSSSGGASGSGSSSGATGSSSSGSSSSSSSSGGPRGADSGATGPATNGDAGSPGAPEGTGPEATSTGCGCRMAGSRSLPGGAAAGLGGLALFGVFRRRRRSKASRD